jgi:hypothetical protein
MLSAVGYGAKKNLGPVGDSAKKTFLLCRGTYMYASTSKLYISKTNEAF